MNCKTLQSCQVWLLTSRQCCNVQETACNSHIKSRLFFVNLRFIAPSKKVYRRKCLWKESGFFSTMDWLFFEASLIFKIDKEETSLFVINCVSVSHTFVIEKIYICVLHLLSKQECIPVWYVPPAYWPYPVVLGGGGQLPLNTDPPRCRPHLPLDADPPGCRPLPRGQNDRHV